MDQNALVDLITREVVKLLAFKPKPGEQPEKKTRLLILLESASALKADFCLKLAEIKGIHCCFLLEDKSEEDYLSLKLAGVSYSILFAGSPELDAVLESAALVLVPDLSIFTLSRIAELSGATPVSLTLIKAVLLAKRILVDFTSLNSLFKLSANLPQALLDKIKERINQLYAYGIKDLDLKELALQLSGETPIPPQNPAKRCVITFEDIDQLVKSGEKVLLLPANAVITPLAREELEKRGIEIKSF